MKQICQEYMNGQNSDCKSGWPSGLLHSAACLHEGHVPPSGSLPFAEVVGLKVL